MVTKERRNFILCLCVFCVFSLLLCIVWTMRSSQYEIPLPINHYLRESSRQLCNKFSSLYSLNRTENDTTTGLERYRKYIFTVQSEIIDKENFTIVMLTYKRESILPKILLHYCKTPRLDRIVVIWNDIEHHIPEALTNLTQKCEIDIVFVEEKENKITNRFKPRKEINTDCVFIVDDDLWFDDLNDVVFAFNVWQENRHRIVGFYSKARSYSLNSKGVYSYDQISPKEPLSIMMTATGFLHRAYMELYFDEGAGILPAGWLKNDDWTMYCDDLLMNCVVGRFLELVAWPQPSLVAIEPNKAVENFEKEAAKAGGHPGLHRSRPDHYKRRSDCLNKIARLFNHLPLHYTKVIVHQKN